MNTQLKKKLASLADRYENSDFLKEDPSQFMHRYSTVRDREVVAFIASSLAFGNRKQILSHIQMILDDVDKTGGKKNSSVAEYILGGKYRLFFRPADGLPRNVCSAEESSGLQRSCGSAKDADGLLSGSGLAQQAGSSLSDGSSAKDADGLPRDSSLAQQAGGSNDMSRSFYRVFTYGNMCAMFDVLREILLQEKTLGAYFKKKYQSAVAICKENAGRTNTRGASVYKENTGCDNKANLFAKQNTHYANNAALAVNNSSIPEPPLYEIIREPFLNRGCGNLIPYTKNSACKRIQLFLRWMVRDNSAVDLGLWKWYDKSKLLLPLDVHVLQESVSFGLLKPSGGSAKTADCLQKNNSDAKKTACSQNSTSSAKESNSLPDSRTSTNIKIPSATIKMAQELTQQMKLVWPDDPVKGDYALFGLGVN